VYLSTAQDAPSLKKALEEESEAEENE